MPLNRDEFDDSPLLSAVKDGRKEDVHDLLKNVTDTALKNEAMILAIKKDKPDIVSILIDNNTNVDHQDNVFKRTPLMWSVHFRRRQVAIALLEYNPNMNLKDRKGKTAYEQSWKYFTNTKDLLEKHRPTPLSLKNIVIQSLTEDHRETAKMLGMEASFERLTKLNNRKNVRNEILKNAE